MSSATRASDKTIIMYDAGRVLGQAKEFANVSTELGVAHVHTRIKQMNAHIEDLQEYFSGEIRETSIVATDVLGNQTVITEGVLTLTVDYYLSIQELRYLKDIDPYLMAIM